MLEWARLLLLPAQALAHELFRADGARAWLYGAAAHGDVPPDGSGSAIAATHLNSWAMPSAGRARRAAPLRWPTRSLATCVAWGANAHQRAGGANRR